MIRPATWLTAILGLAATTTHASITIEVQGIVTGTYTGRNASTLDFAIGDRMTGFITYDPSTPGVKNNVAGNEFVSFAYFDAVTSLDISFDNSYRVTSNGPSQYGQGSAIRVDNATPGAGRDRFLASVHGTPPLFSEINNGPLLGPIVNGMRPALIEIIYEDSSGTAFQDTSLPDQPLDLSLFDPVQNSNLTWQLIFYRENRQINDEPFIVYGRTIVVPEPTAGALGVTVLAVIAAARRARAILVAHRS